MAMVEGFFLENIEWFDETGNQMVYRVPPEGSGAIKWGAQLTVRESQAAVFFYQGKAYDAFPAGRHTLKTANIPILHKVMSVPWGGNSPLRAEVYFVNLKVFTNLTWGTRDPVAFRDSDLGLIRLRAFGIFDVQVLQPVLFINSLVGTQGVFTTEAIEAYLARVIVSRFNDHLGEHLDTLFNLPGRYDDLSAGLTKRLEADLGRYGLGLRNLYINSITPPPDVQQAIDDKSRLGIFDDLDKLVKMKAAMALEKGADNQGDAGAGMGMGLGLMMPAMLAQSLGLAGPRNENGQDVCADCGQPIAPDSRFCSHCGAQVVVLSKCTECGKNLPPGAGFCPRCGHAVQADASGKHCSKCGAENLGDSVFCNQCGDRL